MISSIEICNFLSHKQTTLEFSKGVNVIVGPTDSGKSAIIRALRWLISNRPMGDGMRSSWGGLTIAGVVVDGQMVFRQKDQGRNRYLIANEEFNAIKGEVPAEVQKLLNLGDINLQTQFESHFLLSKSPGEIASHFNKVAHLDKIDVGLQNIQKWLREVDRDIQSSSQQLKEWQDKLIEYENIEEIDSKLQTLENIQWEVSQLNADCVDIRNLVEGVVLIDTQIQEYSSLIEIERLVDSILDVTSECNNLIGEFCGMNSFLNDIKDVDKEIQQYSSLIDMELLVDNILKVISNHNDLFNQSLVLQALLNDIKNVDDDIQTTSIRIDKLHKKFHDELGEVCPLCGSAVPSRKVNKLIKN